MNNKTTIAIGSVWIAAALFIGVTLFLLQPQEAKHPRFADVSLLPEIINQDKIEGNTIVQTSVCIKIEEDDCLAAGIAAELPVTKPVVHIIP